MAVPLPVTEQPLQAPFDAPVLAEAVVLYPEAEAEQVQTWSYFNNEGIEVEVYIGASPGYMLAETIVGPTEYEESGKFVGGSCMFCLPGGTSVFLSKEQAASFDVWRLVPGTPGLSAVFFRWLDVSTFFWYYPPGEVVETFTPPDEESIPEIPMGPECPPDEAQVGLLCDCLPGGRAVQLTWLAQAPSCPVGSTTWDGGVVPAWDNGFACWSPEE
jgi:hypothetical protein